MLIMSETNPEADQNNILCQENSTTQSTPTTSSSHPQTIQQLKSQLVSINQQLSTKNDTEQQEFININNIAHQLEQQCDQLISFQDQFQFQMKQQQLDFKQLQIELQQQQLEMKEQQLQYEHKFNQQQLKLDQQQMKIEQRQLEFKQQQIDFQEQMKLQQNELKLEMKQQLFDLQCQRREFELLQQQGNTTLIQPNKESHTTLQQQTPTLSLFNIDQLQHGNEITTPSTTPTSSCNNSYNSNEQHDLILQVLEDYQAMKYLVERSTSIQESFHNQSELLIQNAQQVQETKIQFDTQLMKLNQIESTIANNISQSESKLLLKINPIETKIKLIETKSTQFNDRIQFIEVVCHKEIKNHQKYLDSIENQRKQVPLILAENTKKLEKNKHEPISVQFETNQGVFVNMTCGRWSDGRLHPFLHQTVIDNYLKTDLSPHKAAIENGKLYISTKSVLNGEWFQVQGDGAIVDIKQISLHQLIKPGDDRYGYQDYPCSKNCSLCKGNGKETTEKRFLIKFKWE